jgi:hypothetical protein
LITSTTNSLKPFILIPSIGKLKPSKRALPAFVDNSPIFLIPSACFLISSWLALESFSSSSICFLVPSCLVFISSSVFLTSSVNCFFLSSASFKSCLF